MNGTHLEYSNGSERHNSALYNDPIPSDPSVDSVYELNGLLELLMKHFVIHLFTNNSITRPGGVLRLQKYLQTSTGSVGGGVSELMFFRSSPSTQLYPPVPFLYAGTIQGGA